MKVFVKILQTLFKNFEICGNFAPWLIEKTIAEDYRGNANLIEELSKIRLTVIRAMLETVREFTTKCINRKYVRI